MPVGVLGRPTKDRCAHRTCMVLHDWCPVAPKAGTCPQVIAGDMSPMHISKTYDLRW
jgi:hypothetical protein